MVTALDSKGLLALEARGLLARLETFRSLALHDAMVPAAAITPAALLGIERSVREARAEVRDRIESYLAWLAGRDGRQASPAEAQRRIAQIRLAFNAALTRYDIFAVAITQRSEPGSGVWLAGLDALARDALALGGVYATPPVVCYLDRGAGAAIRRARTRLPGGGRNPVAIIRVPRERMVGSGIASSHVHEVGHQAAALLDLVRYLRADMVRHDGATWRLWERWISEIIADFWSVARLGIGSTLGLISVLSLPRAFVFRITTNDPHPTPWLRVQISAAIGDALYPDPQWRRLAAVWRELYPIEAAGDVRGAALLAMHKAIPNFVALLALHRPPSLRGRTLAEVLRTTDRQPGRLAALWSDSRGDVRRLSALPPTIAMAVLGQAKLSGRLGAADETRIVGALLTSWALRATLDSTTHCAEARRHFEAVPAI